ncbi:hypothetical protein CISIN_1g039756mg [Citrus sinensis]|uniref:Uncharacterized protein n=1 Tax=Citrus sinensis TaxID=2711 RepID=A0A067EYV9_CITSI|nr:hypothetical protein CISIN_1g039756mg [Citrus sinensis]
MLKVAISGINIIPFQKTISILYCFIMILFFLFLRLQLISKFLLQLSVILELNMSIGMARGGLGPGFFKPRLKPTLR